MPRSPQPQQPPDQKVQTHQLTHPLFRADLHYRCPCCGDADHHVGATITLPLELCVVTSVIYRYTTEPVMCSRCRVPKELIKANLERLSPEAERRAEQAIQEHSVPRRES